jgi:hypothetical protein
MSEEVDFYPEIGDFAVVYMPGARPALEVAQGLAFVLNISEIEAGTDVSLADRHQLRKASEEEVAAIKDVLTNHAAETDWGLWQNGEQVVEGDATTYKSLPQEEWRYFVIAFDGSNSTVVEVERALSIAAFEIKIAFTILPQIFPGRKTPILIYSPPRLFSQVRRMASKTLPAIKVTAKGTNAIRQLREQLQTNSDRGLNLEGFIQRILEMDALPHESPLLFLGYFAVLESLLTHKVKETDTIDSITRQIKQKVILLDNRWEPSIDYGPFHGTKPDRIWSTMYSYRSDLAHGGTPDFAKDLKVLGDHHRALSLLKQTVKSVLRHALIEPQLILDLRNC